MRKNVIKVVILLLVLVVVFLAMIGIKESREQEIIMEKMGVSGGLEDSIFEDDSYSEGVNVNNDENSSDDNDKNTSENNKKDTNKKQNNNSGSAITKPSDSSSDSGGNSSNISNGKMSYEKFRALTPAKQQEYMESFKNTEDFFDWYNKAKAKYEKENPSIEVGGGAVELEK